MSVPELAHIAVLSGDTERAFEPKHIGQAILYAQRIARHGGDARLRFCWDTGAAVDDGGLPYLCGDEFDMNEPWPQLCFRVTQRLISGFPLISEEECLKAPEPNIEV